MSSDENSSLNMKVVLYLSLVRYHEEIEKSRSSTKKENETCLLNKPIS